MHTKAKGPKSFQDEYLEFGLWPDLPLQTQADLRAKYKAQKVKTHLSQTESQQLRLELSAVTTTPCPTCAMEKAQHQHTKRALEEAVALSSVLLKQVLQMNSSSRNRSSSVVMSPKN